MRTFAALWFGYGAYYLCRANISLALPGIMAEFHLDKTTMGAVVTGFFVAYAAGQLLNGQLADRFGGRAMLTAGALGSVVITAAFGFSGAVAAMTILWLANGYFQAMGWTATIKTMANWFPPRLRGHMTGWLGTSFQIGNAYAWLLAGYLIAHQGWRWAFWAPAALLAVVGIAVYAALRDAPEDVGLPCIEAEDGDRRASDATPENRYLGLRYTLRQSLANPRIWLVGAAAMAVQLTRWGMLVWVPTYLFEAQHDISAVTLRAIALPLAGSVGAVVAGWLTDRFLQSRRAPVIVVQLALLAGCTLIFPRVASDSFGTSLSLLLLIGALTAGPDVLLAGSIPMDLGTRKAAGSATGLVDALGYAGAAIGAAASGWFADAFGWNWAFVLWAVSAALGAALAAPLWNYRPPRREYL
jgi:sugar phosphate permease